jgi:ABC-type multidrug transport system fused ATPase/permease subunit
MTTEQFTTEEIAQETTGSAKVLGRFLREVPLLRRLFIPNIVFATVATGGYSFFLWLSGTYAECAGATICPATAFLERYGIRPTLPTLCALAFVIFIVRLVQWVVFESGGQLASQQLFSRMVHGVGHVRTTFFDEYPSGKIINRLAKDADHLRVSAPIRIGDAVSALVELLVVAGIIGYANPVAALAVFPALGTFFMIQRSVAPMLQRVMTLRSIRFGEVLHRESDIIEGVRSFDLYGGLPALFARLSQSVYKYMQMHFLRGQIEAWGRFWSEIAVSIYGALTLAAVYISIHYGQISTVFGVVILTAVFRLSGTFAWLTWSLGLLFETAGHARRVFEYVDLQPEEREEGILPPPLRTSDEPDTGALALQNYSMSYRKNTPLILRDLSLTIPQRQKVGLVGRTGAGKTSLVQSLFRMVYIQGGDIRVGNRSIFHMPIAEARALFAIVPQDPYLFEGTIRSNLDRYSEFTDAELFDALSLVQLPFDLSTHLLEGGANLSLGQRQLLCLARVILTKRPFVVMDEPTSGVDTITDAIMQGVLRTALADRTIITIAHRLETLTRMDRIIELADGAIVRDGPPGEILPVLTEAELA